MGSRNRQVGARADPSIGRRPAGKSASFARWAPPFTRATKPTRALPAAVASTSRSAGSTFNGSQREPMRTAFPCCIHFSIGELAIRLPLVTHPYPFTPVLHLRPTSPVDPCAALPSSLIRVASNFCAGPEESASKRLEACDGAGAGSGAFQSPRCLAVQLLAEFPELPIRAGHPHEISIGEPPTPRNMPFCRLQHARALLFLDPPAAHALPQHTP